MTPKVKTFFDPVTQTASHILIEPGGRHCAIIDPVLDFDPASGRTRTGSADLLIDYVQGANLQLAWIVETHVHADHLTAAAYVKSVLGGLIGIGEGIRQVQATFAQVFDMEPEFCQDGSQFDYLFADREVFMVGELAVHVMSTPGHTPACVTYLAGDAAFVGDTLFMPDVGTARADFPGGDAAVLYRSIHRILNLPEATRLFVCHDYLNGGRRQHQWESSVARQRRYNIHVGDGASLEDFVALRKARDQQLKAPNLIMASIQLNMRAGQFPPPEENGISYLKIPLNHF